MTSTPARVKKANGVWGQLLILVLLLTSPLSLADFDGSTISPLNQGDMNHMDAQRKIIDDLARRYLGTRLRKLVDNDLQILQKLLDQRLVRPEQTHELQAMGVVIGDLYVKEMGTRWVIYRDSLGRSRALQWSDEKELLFPITMISRRAEVGVKVQVTEIYEKGLSILAKQRNRPKRLF